MQKILIAAAIVTSLFACNSTQHATNPNNKLSKQEKADGWQLLFDGESTNGWHKYGSPGKIGAAWKVKQGILWLDTLSKDGGDIVSDKEYENYHLKLEWKVAKNGNSGIIFNIHEDKPQYNWPWQTGPEMQIIDNDGHPDAKYNKHRAGDLYDLIACSREVVKPGEWNLAEIKLVNGKLDLYLNGENVVSTTMWDDNWKKLVGSSKFKTMPGFGTYKKGRIGLQDHGNEVLFRNIMIKEL